MSPLQENNRLVSVPGLITFQSGAKIRWAIGLLAALAGERSDLLLIAVPASELSCREEMCGEFSRGPTRPAESGGEGERSPRSALHRPPVVEISHVCTIGGRVPSDVI